MAKLIYAMVMSLDGYIEDEQGRFGWGVAGDEELRIDTVHTLPAHRCSTNLPSNGINRPVLLST
jgi:hypothetical protein